MCAKSYPVVTVLAQVERHGAARPCKSSSHSQQYPPYATLLPTCHSLRSGCRARPAKSIPLVRDCGRASTFSALLEGPLATHDGSVPADQCLRLEQTHAFIQHFPRIGDLVLHSHRERCQWHFLLARNLRFSRLFPLHNAQLLPQQQDFQILLVLGHPHHDH